MAKTKIDFKDLRRNPNKSDLPSTGMYISCWEWLVAVKKVLNSDVVFALDEALMCLEMFMGRTEEYLVWIYGPRELSEKFNGIVVLDETFPSDSILEVDGLKFTNFNKTLSDSIEYEYILDMQGITEALSDYYYEHGKSFEGLSIEPEHKRMFESLAQDAMEYYSY